MTTMGMTDEEFRYFMDLMMCTDPWPMGDDSRVVLTLMADQEAQARGYKNWVEAYHNFQMDIGQVEHEVEECPFD